MLRKQLHKNLLLILDPEDPDRFGLNPTDFERIGIRTLQADYARIGRDPVLAHMVKEIAPESILFTRNEDMSKRPLIGAFLRQVRAGYTCLSGIDPDHEKAQTAQVIKDFCNKTEPVVIPDPAPPTQALPTPTGTCSFIFDFEQFGGARYGMPRILPLIESYGVRATFFVTGFMAISYPEVLERIVAGGHEIAIHGRVHEFLQGRSLNDQTDRIAGQIKLLGQFGPVTGANFIYRMDAQSPESMVRAGIKYFVLFRKNVFYRTRFIEASGRPRIFSAPSGLLHMIPVGVETYGLPRAEVEGAINCCLRVARKENSNHISVLMHPFQDGALSRIEATRRLIERLVRDLGLRPIPLNEVSLPVVSDRRPIRVNYNVDDADAPQNAVNRFTKLWWIPEVYHQARIERLADSLEGENRQALFATAPQGDATGVCVYPDRFDDGLTIHADPITGSEAARQVQVALKQHTSINIMPGSTIQDPINCFFFHLPKTSWDWKVLILRLWSKIGRAAKLSQRWKAK
jgi:peptidoglycan/xylan/chitin deacetylase (PgdA/CDA1 family)